MQDFDVIVIGGGHNGLTCAGYLARSGLAVAVLERRDVVGGAAVTEEFHPGFRNSVYSYAVSLLHPAVISDLELHRHGLEILERPAGTISLLDDDHLLLPRNDEQRLQEIARFSERDAKRFPGYAGGIDRVARVLRDLAVTTPPNVGGSWHDLVRALGAGNRLRKLDSDDRALLLELFSKSLGDYLDSWFESDPLKGVLGLECVIGNYTEPYRSGSAYVLLHHAFGEVNGRTGAWGHARGGMGAITGAMASYATGKGAVIRTAAAVKKVLVTNRRACGVVLADGSRIHARCVVANVHPQTLLLEMTDPDTLLDPEQRRRIENYRSHSATFRMNVALSELPRFHSLQHADTELLSGAIEICPSLDYITRAWRDAADYGWAREPVISMWIPTTSDDSLAPSGCHVASLFCQHFHRELPDGRNWDEEKDAAAETILATIGRYSDNFRASVLGVQIKSPLDIERDLGMVGGDIFHGALHLDQIFSLRPVAGLADFRMPARGLYLCGSGAHPGGGVSGLPGYNAAREILRDFRHRRL